MADRVYFVDGVLHQETGERNVIVDGVVLQETTLIATGEPLTAFFTEPQRIVKTRTR